MMKLHAALCFAAVYTDGNDVLNTELEILRRLEATTFV
jgi:hypothetical protein